MLSTITTLIITCAEALLAPSPKPAPMVHFGHWIRNCPALPRRCELAQGRQLRLGDEVGWVKFYVSRENDGYALAIETPPLALPLLTIDIGHQDDLALETEDCTAARCRFGARLDYKHGLNLRRADAVTLILTPEHGNTVKVPLDMDQFGRGLGELPEEL